MISIFYRAQNQGNPFELAYRGFAIGDPKVDKQIVAWAEEMLTQDLDHEEYGRFKPWWAEALAQKYGKTPFEVLWVEDPIASKLSRKLADALHNDMFRLVSEANEKREKK